MNTAENAVDTHSPPPRPPSRQRTPLMVLGLGHPTTLPANMVGGATAPLNVKKRQSTRPSLETSVFNTTIKPARKTDAPADKTTERANKPTMTKDSVPSVILTKSHGDLRPPTVQPRRRVSASAIEVLSVASKPRTVSAPMSYPAPGHSFVPEISIDTTLPVQEEDTHHKDKDKEEGAANDTNVRVDSLVRSVTAVTATLSEQSTSLKTLATTLFELKSSQVSSEDVVNSIKMVIEYFQAARDEDRQGVVDGVGGQINQMGTELVTLVKEQSQAIESLRQEVASLKVDREQVKEEASETRHILDVVSGRIALLEGFFLEENRTLAEENDHLQSHLDEAALEISELRQSLAATKEPPPPPPTTPVNGVDEGLETNHVHEDKITKAVSAPCTRSDTIRPTHHRTVSIPSTPVFPGMYPRVRALRREALENNLQRNMALGTAPFVPRIPDLPPQSPFALRFK